MARLRDRGRPTSLTVIGDGPERGGLERLAAELGLTDEVVFAGSPDAQEDVWSWLRGARVLLFPSEREGFRLVLAEALALGTPVVVVDHPRNDATRLVDEGRTGSIVPPDDLDALASAVEHWLDAAIPRTEVTARFWGAHGDLDWDVSGRRSLPRPRRARRGRRRARLATLLAAAKRGWEARRASCQVHRHQRHVGLDCDAR